MRPAMAGSSGAQPAPACGARGLRRAIALLRRGRCQAFAVLLPAMLSCLLAWPAHAQPAGMTPCDILAADAEDPERVAEAVPFDEVDAVLSVPACEDAVLRWPGHPRLLFQLGRAYDSAGRQADGMARYQQAMDAGYGAAASSLAKRLEDDDRPGRDEAEVARLHQWAANRGHVGSMVSLGRLYEAGRGVERDDTIAVAWYNRAFEANGSPAAAFSLARLLVQGRGVPRDPGRAVGMLRAAAQRDHAEAAFFLVRLAEQGEAPGVPWMEQVRLLVIAERAPAYRQAAQASLDRLATQGGADAVAAARRTLAMRAATREQGEAAVRHQREVNYLRVSAAIREADARVPRAPPGPQGNAAPRGVEQDRDVWSELLEFARQWFFLYLGIVAAGYVFACVRILRRRQAARLDAGPAIEMSRGFGSFLTGMRSSLTHGEGAVMALMALGFSGLGFATYYALSRDSGSGHAAWGLSLAASLLAPVAVFLALNLQKLFGSAKTKA